MNEDDFGGLQTFASTANKPARNKPADKPTPAPGPAADEPTRDELEHAAGMGGSYEIGADGKPVLLHRTQLANVTLKAENVSQPKPDADQA